VVRLQLRGARRARHGARDARARNEICAERLGELQAGLVPPPSGVGSLLGLPELDALEARIMERAAPPLLSAGERMARCACAVAAGTASQRLDYAIHTATFRLWPASDIAAARSDFVDLATNSRCAGASP